MTTSVSQGDHADVVYERLRDAIAPAPAVPAGRARLPAAALPRRARRGVYHLGFEEPDLAAAETEAAGLGLGVIARGRRADGSGFCYFDTRPRAGVVLEVRRTSAEPG